MAALKNLGRVGWAAVLLVAVFAARAANTDGALPPPQYVIKQSEPSTGTRIPRKIAQSSDIPLNRTYEQFTEEEQQVVRAQYEAMRPTDEPPFPVKGLRPIFDAIAEVQRLLLVQGTLSMFADVDAQGVVTSISVNRSPDPKLTQAAANVLMLTTFKPAVCKGQPCQMAFPLRVTFTVEH